MSAKAKHTPGPWFTCPQHKKPDGLKLIGIGNGCVHVGYASVTPIMSPFEAEANARLIAAAPDLLEALRGMLGNYLDLKRISLAVAKSDAPNWIGQGMTEDGDIHVQRARAAIAKATGKGAA